VIGDKNEKVVAKLWNMLNCLLSSCREDTAAAAAAAAGSSQVSDEAKCQLNRKQQMT
jgi:hypothetical protein